MSVEYHDLTCTHDLAGNILSVNRTAALLLGISGEKLKGMRIQDVILPSALDDYSAYVDALRLHGYADGTMLVRGRDGRVRVWEYHNVLGADRIVHGTAHDVTERERALRALKQSEEHFRSIIENVSDVITVVDFEGTIRYASPSIYVVSGATAEEMNGRSFFELVCEEDRARALTFFDRQSTSSDPAMIELRFRDRNGGLRDVEVLAKPLMRGSHILGTIATTRDIRERRRLEAQLERADRLSSLGRLAATVAHEFNNVLMGMLPFAELLQRNTASAHVAATSASHILGSIARGKRIARDILRFTQPLKPVFRAIDVAEWWRVLVPELDAMTSNDIRIETDLPSEPLYVDGDESQLTQVMMNLVTNARDAMPKGGTITLRARRDPAHAELVRFAVSDTGIGIRRDILERVFEPLFTSKPNGTGLGLAVVHQVVTAHGGAVFVDSEVNRGTTFQFSMRAVAAIAVPGCDATEVAAPIVETRRILLVDDEESITEGMGALLRDANFDVAAAGSGEDALKVLDLFDPDVVLLDVTLPGIDGVETWRRMRARRPDLSVIFSSGHDHGDPKDDHTRYLQKPFALDALIDTIAALEATA
jgi:PAS domain S-box-containing protein